MRIRRFKPEDAAETARLHRTTIRYINKRDYPAQQIAVWSGRTTAKRFKASIHKLARFVAEENGKLVGFGDYNPKGELTGLYIHKDFLLRWIGTKLLQRMEQQAYKEGLRTFHLLSTITAKEFYLRHGYHLLRRTTHAIDGHKLTVYKMEKRLKPR